MSMAGDASVPRSGRAPAPAPAPVPATARPRVNRAQRALRHVFNTLGYSLARKDQDRFDCPSLPLPSAELVERAAGYFANSFAISPKCGLSEAEIGLRLKDYFWHYPFKFGDVFVEATD